MEYGRPGKGRDTISGSFEPLIAFNSSVLSEF